MNYDDLDWLDCPEPNCTNKVCRALLSDRCFVHTPGDTVWKHALIDQRNWSYDAIERLQAELAEAVQREEMAWRERNIAAAKVKAWEAVVYVEGLPLRSVRVDEWGPGDGEQVTVPDVTPNRLTELLDEIAAIRERTDDAGR